MDTHRREQEHSGSQQQHRVLVIDHSASLCLLLKTEIEDKTGADVTVCHSIAEARQMLSECSFTVAVAARNLPDGRAGAVVALLERHALPMILLTATFDARLRSRYADAHLVDYFVKDNSHTAAMVAAAISRFISNHAIHVLVVDDSISSRSQLVDILERQNFTVLQAKSGAEAIMVMEQAPVDIVIVDYYMPGVDGYELIKVIREVHPSDEIRLIGVSSSTDRMLAPAFLKAGASDFLYRPFVAEELQCRLDNHVETLMQIRRYRHLAERDPLTGLLNRRAFFDKAQTLVQSLGSTARRGSIAILDIDHFKRINDRYGHEVGDRVLKSVSQRLMVVAQSNNAVAARLGGEEFVMLLADEPDAGAFAMCEAIRKEIAAARIRVAEEDVAVTVSLGLAPVEPQESLSMALNAADQLLYMAKSDGRNRICASFDRTASAA
jgi:diguanylate cyclase (GGDEF)-like protein